MGEGGSDYLNKFRQSYKRLTEHGVGIGFSGYDSFRNTIFLGFRVFQLGDAECSRQMLFPLKIY